MDGDSSFEEDFSETPVFTEEDDEPRMPLQKEVKRNENHSFEILSVEKIVENVFAMVAKVQNILMVSVCNENFVQNL